MNWAIVAAGGLGKRMGEKVNKIFSPLLGKPIIFYILLLLEKAKIIDRVIITAREDDIKAIKQIVKEGKFKKTWAIIPAASTRQKSTWKVLKKLKQAGVKSSDLIGIHNAVNLLVTEKELEAVFAAAQKWGAALLAFSARDTIKITDKENFVKTTPQRKFIFLAQTPQVGRFDWLYQAFEKSEKENFEGTDDTMLLERIGKKVKIVPCSPENFKITYPFDLTLAEAIFKKRSKNGQSF